MLGLADRALVIDLFDEVMGGDVARGAHPAEGSSSMSVPTRPSCWRISPPSPIW